MSAMSPLSAPTSPKRRRPRSVVAAAAETEGCARTARTSRHRLLQTAVLLYVANLLLCTTDAFSHQAPLDSGNVRSRAILAYPPPGSGRYDRFHSSARLFASRERTDVDVNVNSGTASSSSTRSNRRSSTDLSPGSTRSSSSSSRFGVRKRVKSVIQKAKSRKVAKAEARRQQSTDEYGSASNGTGMPSKNDVVVASQSAGVSSDDSEPKVVDEVADEVNGSRDVPISEAVEEQQVEEETETDADVDIPTSPSAPEKPSVELSAKTDGNNKDISPSSETESAEVSSEPIPLSSEAPEEAAVEAEEVDPQEEEPIVAADPPPFDLPELSDDQQRQLDMGERVQFQNDMGREGSGFVVLDVKAPPDVVWECLLDFQSYPETIPTVREVTMYTNTHLSGDYRSEKPVGFEDGTMATLAHGIPSTTRAAFTLSKFRLKIAAIHQYTPHSNGDYMVFTLDPACTNLVLKAAKGVWHTQSNPDNKGEDYTRVWLLCEVKVSKLLPQWITDYAARRAMPRATTWLRPQVEAANALWLNKKRRRRRRK